MQFSIGVEYALHSLFYMMEIPAGNVIGIKDLSTLHTIPETYLSKIFTKLRKGGIVRSLSGTKGGYELAKNPMEISFWDVVEAVEGSSHMFQCAEIRKNNILSENDEEKSKCPCLIKVVMYEAEEQMRNYLRDKSLEWLKEKVYNDFSDDKKEAITKWVDNSINK